MFRILSVLRYRQPLWHKPCPDRSGQGFFISDKQIDTHPFLQIANLPADRTLGQIQFACSAGKVQMPGGGLKTLQGRETRKRAPHVIVIRLSIDLSYINGMILQYIVAF